MHSPALDSALLPASAPQRRAALAVIGGLVGAALLAAPFAGRPLGPLPGYLSLYGGAMLMGLAITAAILLGQFAQWRKPSLLLIGCGALFAAIVFVPYVLSVPDIAAGMALGGRRGPSPYLWTIWHTALPLVFVAYALLAAREGRATVRRGMGLAAMLATVLAAWGAVRLCFVLADRLPLDAPGAGPPSGLHGAAGLVVLVSGAALVLLLRRSRGTVVGLWLLVPASALLIEALFDALAGTRYSLGWYVARLDGLVAGSFLVVALLNETNRLSRVLRTSRRRLRGIVEGVADALLVVDDRQGTIVSLNPAAAALFGAEAADVVGTPLAHLLPELDATAPGAAGTACETVARDASGTLFPVELARGRATRDVGETILILRDITQRKRAADAIRAAHDRAVEAAAAKSQFLATISHEIRTPINAVVGMSELLLQTPLSAEARDYASIVRDSAESLLAIVDDILSFSQIEGGRLELDAVRFVPREIVEGVGATLSVAAHAKGLALVVEVAPDVPACVLGDADRLRHVLRHLIGNAVKFTAEGGVAVRVEVERGEAARTLLRFTVADSGPGIAADLAEELFEPFRQADGSSRRRFGGTGLGLSLARRLVELMGGRIGVESMPEQGACFWFSVPFELVDEPAAAELSGAGSAAVGAAPPHAADPAPPLAAGATPAGEVLVLVAEDNPVNRKLALQQLKKLGYRAQAVDDGQAAVDAVAAAHYDLVLMDCQMPEVDGFEATRAIRRGEAVRGGHVPIVAMTANALEGDREACLSAGMDGYLAKPVQLAALRGVVEQFTGVSVAR